MDTRTLDPTVLSQRVAEAATRAGRAGQLHGLEPLPGGESSLTFTGCWGRRPEDRLVIKVAPPGLEPVRNRDVLRQAKVLRALSGTGGIRVPRVVFDDAGDPPDAPPFFAMEFVPGRAFEPNLDSDVEAVAGADVSGRARTAARMLAALHRQDLTSLDLGDESQVTLAEEVERWSRAFDAVGPFVDTRAGEVMAELRRTLPVDGRPALLHGDYRLGNMLCSGPSVNAVIDWEIWNVGDPRCDLGWFLVCSTPGAHPTGVRVHPGMPPGQELEAEYRESGGEAPGGMDWFRSLAVAKMAAATALIARNQSRAGRAEVSEEIRGRALRMLDVAVARL